MKKFFSGLRKTETVLAVTFMVAFTAVGFLQVFFRVFIKNPLAWSEELCRYLFVWSMFLGAVLVAANDEHFKVDFVVSLFPKSLQTMFRYVSYVFVAVFSVLLIKYGLNLMLANPTRITPALGIKAMYIYTIFPINGVLVLLHLVEQILADLVWKKGDSLC
ncbi:MAG: TRAP transporter small permease [Candidatus Fimivivens sp.]